MRPPRARSQSARAGAPVAGRDAAHRAHGYVDRFATPVERDPATVPSANASRCCSRPNARCTARRRSPSGAPGSIYGAPIRNSLRRRVAHRADDRSERRRDLGAWPSATATRRCASGPAITGCTSAADGRSIELAALRENAARIGEEAHQLLAAPQCPSGTLDLILGRLAGLAADPRIVRSRGRTRPHHGLGGELQRHELPGSRRARQAALRFADRDDRNRQHDAARLRDLGYDDEGTKSVRADVIRDGISSVSKARATPRARSARESTACMRAESWEHVPMIRMCNLNLLPGDVPFENLFDDVRDGVYMESNRSWSIDDRRLNFQFGTQIGWEIKNGKRGRMLKNPDLRRRNAGVLELVRRDRRRARRGSHGARRTAARAGRCRPAARPRPPRRHVSATSRSESAMDAEAARGARRTRPASARAPTRPKRSWTSDHRASPASRTRAIHQNVDVEDVVIRVRAIVDGRTGVATTNACDDRGPRRRRRARARDRRVRAAGRRTPALAGPRERRGAGRRLRRGDRRRRSATSAPDVAARSFAHAERTDTGLRATSRPRRTASRSPTSAGARALVRRHRRGANVKMTAADSTGFAERYATDVARARRRRARRARGSEGARAARHPSRSIRASGR